MSTQTINLSTVMDKLYALEKKDIKDYTNEDNIFIYSCICNDNKYTRELAKNTLAISFTSYILCKAKDMVASKKSIKKLGEEEILEIYQAGQEAVSKKMIDFDPFRNTKIHTYLTWSIDAFMDAELDYHIKGIRVSDNEREKYHWMKAVEPILKEEGIKNPTAQDYYNRAREEGKSEKTYNLTIMARLLEYKKLNELGSASLEGLEEIGTSVPSETNVCEFVIDNTVYDEDIKIIEKLGYHDRIAIQCKIEADNFSPNEYAKLLGKKCDKKFEDKVNTDNPNKKNKIKNDYMYLLFLKKTELNKKELSKKEFERLLAEAINEFRKRKYNKKKPILKKNNIDNSLQLDDSYDSFFDFDSAIEDTINKMNPGIVEEIYRKEFNETYPVLGIPTEDDSVTPKASESMTLAELLTM